MSSHPFYQPPTPGRKIVHPFKSALFYVAGSAAWLFIIIGVPVLVETLAHLILGQ